MEETNKTAKTHKGKRFLASKQPKEIEDPKKCLFLNTSQSSEITKMILEDLVSLIISNLVYLVFYKKGSSKEIRKEKRNS